MLRQHRAAELSMDSASHPKLLGVLFALLSQGLVSVELLLCAWLWNWQ